MPGDTWECQGRDEHGQFGSGTCGFDSPNNVDALASIIETEAGAQNAATKQAVAWTVVNRMLRNHTAKVRDVWNAYIHVKLGRSEARTIVRQVLAGDLKDITHGATHMYTPGGMPLEGERTNGKDVAGGLESVPGVLGHDRLPARNYRPGFASKFTPVEVPNVPPVVYTFYRQPGNGPVDHDSRPARDALPANQPAR